MADHEAKQAAVARDDALHEEDICAGCGDLATEWSCGAACNSCALDPSAFRAKRPCGACGARTSHGADYCEECHPGSCDRCRRTLSRDSLATCGPCARTYGTRLCGSCADTLSPPATAAEIRLAMDVSAVVLAATRALSAATLALHAPYDDRLAFGTSYLYQGSQGYEAWRRDAVSRRQAYRTAVAELKHARESEQARLAAVLVSEVSRG